MPGVAKLSHPGVIMCDTRLDSDSVDPLLAESYSQIVVVEVLIVG